jgi:NADPH:quinone reductase-like Zn-dependent oxidoreductase
MKAAAFARFGPTSVLHLVSVPVPEPGPREVLLELEAAGLGSWDVSLRSGAWRMAGEKFPIILGSEGTGRIVQKGARVRGFKIGERVIASELMGAKGGFHAPYVVVKSEHIVRAPRRLDSLQAGSVATTGLTALQGIDDALRVKKGETVLIIGATGAVGTLAVQFARWRGAHVIATGSGRDAKLLLRALGAHEMIDARKSDAADTLCELAHEGIDAALVLAGGKQTEKLLDELAPRGRIAYPNGVEPVPKKRKGIRAKAYDGESGRKELDRLAKAITQARLRVPIAESYPLAQAQKAHARVEKGHVLGRVAFMIRR